MNFQLRYRVLLLVVATALAACGGSDSGASLTVLSDAEPEAGQATDSVGSGEDLATVDGPCVMNCKGKQCGSSGCPGYVCGHCPQGEQCSDDSQCVPEGKFCEPGDTKCTDGGVAVCNEAGKAWGPPAPCADDEICVDGGCVENTLPPICDPGDRVCAGNSRVVCLENGTGWSDPVACQPGTECKSGECVPVVVGEDDCQAVLYCMLGKNCGSQEPDCMPECFDKAPPAAKSQAEAVYDCIFEQCFKWGPNEPCFQTQQFTYCAGQFAQCKSGGCMPDCNGKMCGPDGCGGNCGQCGAGLTCKQGQCQAEPQGCNGITWQGCCDGKQLKYCEDNQLQTESCDNDPKCGWNYQKQFYDCGTMGGSDPSGKNPKQCSGGCNPDCAGKQCGSDGCGGSCGNCPQGTQCDNNVCQSDDYGCPDIAACALGCNFSASCVWDCYGGASPSSKQLFDSVAWCVGEHCVWNMTMQCIQDALDGSCHQLYEQCLAD